MSRYADPHTSAAVPLGGAPVGERADRAPRVRTGHPPTEGLAIAFYPDRVARTAAPKARTPSQALRLPDSSVRQALVIATAASVHAYPRSARPFLSTRPEPSAPAAGRRHRAAAPRAPLPPTATRAQVPPATRPPTVLQPARAGEPAPAVPPVAPPRWTRFLPRMLLPRRWRRRGRHQALPPPRLRSRRRRR